MREKIQVIFLIRFELAPPFVANGTLTPKNRESFIRPSSHHYPTIPTYTLIIILLIGTREQLKLCVNKLTLQQHNPYGHAYDQRCIFSSANYQIGMNTLR
jgi:hypothetical protein